uniref:CUB domain-containing protein n=1 Tax=Panagrolaimus davidi TaxID=227884 RepID=A0A914PGW6_9BILA
MFNGTSGSLTSPNYPSNYTSGDTQYYKFFAPKNHRLIITVWDFVTEVGYDWLQIYDGEFANTGTPLLDWSGNKSTLVPKILTTTTNAASLVWYTDFVKTYRGYNLTWVAENYFG